EAAAVVQVDPRLQLKRLPAPPHLTERPSAGRLNGLSKGSPDGPLENVHLLAVPAAAVGPARRRGARRAQRQNPVRPFREARLQGFEMRLPDPGGKEIVRLQYRCRARLPYSVSRTECLAHC